MKITSIEVKHYLLPLAPPFKPAWDPAARTQFTATLVFVHTNEGLTGIGSGDLMLGFKGHEHLFIGQDPFAMARHSQVLANLDFHYGRCWPLDLALWDLLGKAAGQPVYKLLGGGSDRIPAYASTAEIVSPQERVERTHALVEKGFKAMKIRFHHPEPDKDIQVVEAVRRSIGDDLVLMVDANQGWRMPWDVGATWDFKTALRVSRQLEEFGVYWLEEPLDCTDVTGMAQLRRQSRVRIAGGEMNRTDAEFRELIRQGALDIYQPDAALCGGITRVKRIAELAQANGACFSPHTWTNGIGLLANLHLACGIGLTPYIEFPYDPPVWTGERRDFILANPVRIDPDGYLVILPTPGLGIELDAQALKRYEIQ